MCLLCPGLSLGIKILDLNRENNLSDSKLAFQAQRVDVDPARSKNLSNSMVKETGIMVEEVNHLSEQIIWRRIKTMKIHT
jgi:hypothetical protein